MPQILQNTPSFRPRKDIEAEWNSWRKGLNLLLRPTELGRDELSTADNILLTGSGIPTGRWGSTTLFTAGATGTIRALGTFKNTTSLTNEIIALTDQGYLVKQNELTSTVIPGMSYPSGTTVRSEQLGGSTFFVSKDAPAVKYNGASLSVYATLSPPTGLSATNYSGASGTYAWSWRVTALNTVGETTGSTAAVLSNLPQNLSDTEIRLFWTGVSGSVTGYQVYRGLSGDETFLGSVGPSTTQFIDRGEEASQTILSPLENNTGGPKSAVIAKSKDRLLLVDANDRTKLLISGRYPNHFKFNWTSGGGSVYVDPDSGQDITGIAVQPGADRIVVYKDFSHFAVELSTVSIGNFIVLDPQYVPISTSVGCSSPDTIATVENDTFYFGRKGIYVTGFEPNFLNLIRTNEVSARMRPYLSQLNNDDYTTACAFYVDNKYVLSFPKRKECIVYDRERGSFAGVWKLPFGISKMLKHTDASGTERWVIGSYNDNTVYYFSSALSTDSGTAIQKTIRTNKEVFGKWSLLKIVKFFYALFRRVQGQVNVSIIAEMRNGLSTTIKSFTVEGAAVSGNTGWGVSMWGDVQWGLTDGEITIAGDEITRYTQLFKQIRLLQVEITTTEANANFELIGLRMTASSQGEGSLSSTSRV
jgi:hypothetical protein